MKTTTATPVIEVKKVAFGAEATHQETLNFQCDVYVDGLKTAWASNSGRGGQTNVRPYDAAGARERFNAASAYCATLPEHEFEPLESFIDDLVNDIYNQKQREKEMKSFQRKFVKEVIIVNEEQYKDGTFTDYRRIQYKMPIADILKHPVGKVRFKEQLAKAKKELRPGEAIVNPDLQDLLKEL
jgi:hypothetical protein